MGLLASEKDVFLKYKGHTIVALGLENNRAGLKDSPNHYFIHKELGRRFDIRDLPREYIGWANDMEARVQKRRAAVEAGDATTCIRVLKQALDDGYDFNMYADPVSFMARVREEFYFDYRAAAVMARMLDNAQVHSRARTPEPVAEAA